MDFLQLVFGFVNAPLFATFLLGMFWKRATGHGAFWGLVTGTTAAALTHGLTLAEGKGGWLTSSPVMTFGSAMSQAFHIASIAWIACFVMTIAVSLFTKPKTDAEMKGLVYSLTEKPDNREQTWIWRPVPPGLLGVGVTALINCHS